MCSMTTGLNALNSISSHAFETINITRLNLADRNKIVVSKLAKHGKILDNSLVNNLQRQLTTKRDASLPLYLDLACEQLRNFGLHSRVWH